MKRKQIALIFFCALAFSIFSSSSPVFAKIELLEADEVEVIAENGLTLHESEPDSEGKPGKEKGHAAKGDKLTVIRQPKPETSWCEMRFIKPDDSTIEGWGDAQQVRFIPPTYRPGDRLPVILAVDVLKIHIALYKKLFPTQFKMMTETMKPGDTLTVIQQFKLNPRWVQVQTPTGQTGWVNASRKYVTPITARVTEPPAAEEEPPYPVLKLEYSNLENKLKKIEPYTKELEVERDQLADQVKRLEQEKTDLAKRNTELEQKAKRKRPLETEEDSLKNRLDQATKALQNYQKVMGDWISAQLETNPVTPSPCEIPLPNSEKRMHFVSVPAGELTMGLSTEEVNAFIRETNNPAYDVEEVKPEKRVQHVNNGFMIGKYEVTHEEYQTLIPAHHYASFSARQPVTNLTEAEIRQFCKAFNEAYPQLSIGLPTEKEWEYAAKGEGGNHRYTWKGQFDKKKANVDSQKLMAVGQKAESDSWCGVSDLIGNAAEVCEMETDTYTPKTEQRLVARGGSYQSDQDNSRITTRHLLWNPKRDDIGFRGEAQGQLASLQLKHTDLEKEYNQVVLEGDHLKKDKEQLENRVRELEDKIGLLQLKSRYDEGTEQLKTIQKSGPNGVDGVEKKGAEGGQKNEPKSGASEEVKKLKNQIKGLEKENQTLKASQNVQQVKKFKAEVEQVNQLNTQLGKKLDDANQRMEVLQKRQDRLVQLEEKANRLEAEKTQLQAEKTQLQAELNPLKEKDEKTRQQMTALQNSYQTYALDVIQSQLKKTSQPKKTEEQVEEVFLYELPLPNSDQRLKWVSVPAGELTMGLSTEEVNAFIRETNNPVYDVEEVPPERRTQHVNNGFMIGKYEVTHEEYHALTPAHHYASFSARQPVTNLTEEEIRAFLKALNDLLKEAYPQLSIGLPTEKEWEYAAKGSGGNHRYTWGDTFDKNKANVASQSLIEGGQRPESESWCGVSDLIGNAAEVCEMETETYTKKVEHPLVARGGSYQSDAQNSRTTSRHPLWNPKRDDIGLRIVIRLKRK
ncbi:SUMF1/EgtB/PvdO family nonheme iron enzyme [Candidatus Peregrinibacteria bacterium]|nr:SUMF1/EgtB/PvdO family nonheme iron enzyme [Candidatus Peregrinibacteria bacterium]